MTTEGCSAAKFDGAHDAALRRRQRSPMLFPIGFAVATKHVSDFQLETIHEPPDGPGFLTPVRRPIL